MGSRSHIGLIAVLALASGCVYASQAMRPEPRFYSGGRPESAYYCYDCHGYRYFDPYYDWCPNYGFVFRWEQHPDLVRTYRERYVALKVRNPQLGRFRYRDGYRGSRHYREPRNYDQWQDARQGRGPAWTPTDPEKGRPERGRKERSHDRDDSSGSRRERGGQRPQRIET